MPVFRVNNCTAGFLALFVCLPVFFRSAVADGALGRELGPVSEFVTGADEVPLMELLTEIPGSAMVFDTPGGRIVEVEATGAASRKQVEEFYAAVLPQLGWQAAAQGGRGLRFKREQEVLTIDVRKQDSGGSLVLFAIAPNSSKEQE